MNQDVVERCLAQIGGCCLVCRWMCSCSAVQCSKKTKKNKKKQNSKTNRDLDFSLVYASQTARSEQLEERDVVVEDVAGVLRGTDEVKRRG
jgi:hypothetical protein